MYQRIKKNSSSQSPAKESSSPFSTRLFPSQKKQNRHQPPTQAEIEDQEFEQNKVEASELQLKKDNQQITPLEEERLGLLQRQIDQFQEQRRKQTERYEAHIANIPVYPPNQPRAEPIQSKLSREGLETQGSETAIQRRMGFPYSSVGRVYLNPKLSASMMEENGIDRQVEDKSELEGDEVAEQVEINALASAQSNQEQSINHQEESQEEAEAKKELIAQSLGEYLNLDSSWIPSTDTLSGSPNRQAAIERILANPNIKKLYVDVLATRGPTVDLAENPDNILGDFDALYGIDHLRKEAERNDIEIVPWLEGTAYWSGNNVFASELLSRGYLLSNDPQSAIIRSDGSIHYADLLDDRVFSRICNFVIFLCKKYEGFFKTLMIDDHFGIHKDSESAMIRKYRPRLGGENVPLKEVRTYIKNGVTQRVRLLSRILAESGVKLSVSVNFFDFQEDDMSLSDEERGRADIDGHWDDALRTNYQDVAQWIEEGLVTGEINVQIYHKNISGVKAKYDKFINILKEHLGDKRNQGEKDYIENFPEISVSIAIQGNGWKILSYEDITALVTYLQNKSKIGEYLGRTFEVQIAGFDGDDFERCRLRIPDPNSGEVCKLD